MNLTQISPETPLAQVTLGQFIEYLKTYLQEPQRAEKTRYVYGLRGIMQLFNVSNMTAQRYKNGIIKDAVTQYGRKIVVDADRALELFRAAKEPWTL